MFKSLKDKLGESLAGTPAKNLIPVGQHKQVGRGGPSDSSTPSGSDRGHALSPDDIPPMAVSRSRTSSVSSLASDASFASPMSVLTPGALDLDGSVSEVETDSASVTAMNKDQLYQMYCKVQRNSRQYKSAYLQVVTAYKEVEKDRDKLKSTLAQTQDKALKKISALREQLESKKHAESNFTTMLNEKEELLKILQLQVSLLKDGKPIPEELRSKSDQLSAVSSSIPSPSSEPLVQVDANSNISTDANVLREKVKRLESLLAKCQETMKSNKEKIQLLTTDREDMSQQLEMKSDELDKFKEEHKDAVLRFQNQLKDARKLIEDLESDKAMSLATMKQEFHETLESKDSELMALKRKVHGLDKENAELKDDVQKLSKTGGEQLEQCREVIRKLNEEKSHLEQEMRQRIENSETTLEREKDSELQELRRGKVEALRVLQQQMQDKIRELEKAKELALEERDREWEKKLSQKEQTKRKEFEEILTEEQEEMALAIEEQYLQRIAIAKQFEVAENNLREEHSQLAQEKKGLEIKLENLRLETSSRIKSLEDELQDVKVANEHRLQEVQAVHDLELESARKESDSTLNRRLEELRVEYTLKISELSANYERRLTESQAEEDASYETMISDVKSRNESAIRDSQVTISQLQNEAKESNERRAELEQRVAELESTLAREKEVSTRLSKEIGESDIRAKTDRDAFQERLRGLIQRIDYQSNAMDEVSEENKRLYLEIASLRAKSEETIEAMRDEMKRFCQATAQNSYTLSAGVALEKSSEAEGAGSSANGTADETGTNQPSEIPNPSVNLEELGTDQLRAEVHKLATEATLRRQHYSHQLASSADTIRTLEQRINEMIERENHLNVELERSKKENEVNLAAHNNEMSSLRSKIDQLSRSERALTEQLRATDERCEAQLSLASTEQISAMSSFSELLTESQSEMATILGELIETKERSNRIIESLEQELDQRCHELENACRRIEELGGSCADIINQSPGDVVAVDASDPNLEGEVLTVLPQSNAQSMPCSAEIRSLENKVVCLDDTDAVEATDAKSNPLPDDDQLVGIDAFQVGDGNTEELLRVISVLESSLAEKDSRISWFEAKVKDFGKQIQVETEEMRMRSRQVELLMADKDELLKDKGELVKNQGLMIMELETKVRGLESALSTKSADFEEIERKFWRLQGDAKSRITALKNRLAEKEAGRETSDVSERAEQLRVEFAAEMAETLQKHEAEVKELKERLEKEEQSMKLFQENVKKQFDERQEKVKFVIEKMRDSCQQSLLDRDNLYEIKLMNLERDKNKERDQAVEELTKTIARLQAEKPTTSGDDDSLEKQAEEINFLKAELESFKVRHRQALSHYQSEREALLKHAGEGSDQLRELMRELEKKSGEDEVDVSADLARKSLEDQLEKLSAENRALRVRVTDLEKQRAAVFELAKEARYDTEGVNPTGAEAAAAEKKAAEEEMERLRSEILSLREKVRMQEVEQKELSEVYDSESTVKEVKRLGEAQDEKNDLNKGKESMTDELAEKVAESEEMKKEENIEHLPVVNDLKELDKAKEDLICELNKKILALEEVQRENANRMEEVGELKEQHKLKQSTIDGLNEKVSALEETEMENRKTWQEKENGFLERIRALEVLSVERAEEFTKLLSAFKTDTETVELAAASAQQEVAGLNEKVFALEEAEKENQKTWQDKEDGFLERIRALEVQSTERAEEVTRLLSAFKADSEMVESASTSAQQLLTVQVSVLEAQIQEKDKLLEDERRRLTDENEAKCTMYEERLSEMEKTDLDLHAQLRELSNKLNSVSENALHLEKVVDEYRGLEVDYQRAIETIRTQLEDERQSSEAATRELEELHRTMEEKNISLLEGNEKLLQMETALRKAEESIHRINEEHLAALEAVNIEWQSKVDALKMSNETVATSEVGSDETNRHSTGKSESASSLPELRNSHGHGDVPAVLSHHAELAAVGGEGDILLNGSGLRVERVERRIHKVVLPVVEFLPDATSNQSNERSGFQERHEREAEQLRNEHKAALQLLEDEHNSKVIQLIKDFNVQMVERERQITESFQEEIETLRKTEARLLSDHLEQTHELNQQLNDRNSRSEEVVQNCEAQIQAADERHRDHVDKLNQIIQDLQQTLLDKEHEWVTSRESVQVKEEETRSRSMLLQSEPTLSFALEDQQMQVSSSGHVPSSFDQDLYKDRVLQLESELAELKQKHSIEVGELTRRLERYESSPLSPLLPGMDHKDSLIALGGDDVCRLLELQNSNLQAEVGRHLTENARLKERERELLCQLESKSVFLYGSHGESLSSSSVLGSLLMEPTEMEYLKNILYKYMIGLETKTLAKVICKVVRFSEDQTQQILGIEESKSSRHSSYHQGAAGSAATSQKIFSPAHR